MIKILNFVLFVSFVVINCVFFFGCGSAVLRIFVVNIQYDS